MQARYSIYRTCSNLCSHCQWLRRHIAPRYHATDSGPPSLPPSLAVPPPHQETRTLPASAAMAGTSPPPLSLPPDEPVRSPGRRTRPTGRTLAKGQGLEKWIKIDFSCFAQLGTGGGEAQQRVHYHPNTSIRAWHVRARALCRSKSALRPIDRQPAYASQFWRKASRHELGAPRVEVPRRRRDWPMPEAAAVLCILRTAYVGGRRPVQGSFFTTLEFPPCSQDLRRGRDALGLDTRRHFSSGSSTSREQDVMCRPPDVLSGEYESRYRPRDQRHVKPSRQDGAPWTLDDLDSAAHPGLSDTTYPPRVYRPSRPSDSSLFHAHRLRPR